MSATMKKVLFVFITTSLLYFTLYPPHVQASDNELDNVIAAAESLFKALQQKDYPKIWTCLSIKSRDTIVSDTCTAIKSPSCSKTSISDDFSRGGTLSMAYWDAYVKYFNPGMVLEESRWEMGSIKGDRAEIIITYKKAQKPATLYMTKEDGMWRVGLTESFWSRK